MTAPDTCDLLQPGQNIIKVGTTSRIALSPNANPIEDIKTLPDNAAALTLTSLPLSDGQYGPYLKSMQDLFREIWNKTMPGGRAAINVSNLKFRQERDGESFMHPIGPDITRIITNSGFTFFDEIIWEEAETEKANAPFENILIFKKAGRRRVNPEIKEMSRLTLEEWREYTRGLWRTAPGPGTKHPTALPREIADRLIRLYSFVNDLILDPFTETGTTIIAADHHRRTGLGIRTTHQCMPERNKNQTAHPRQSTPAATHPPERTTPAGITAGNAIPIGQHSQIIFTCNMEQEHGIHRLNEAAIALTFTSPPYWNFIDYQYENPGIGTEETYEDYINSLKRVFTLIRDKTMPGGSVVINISNMKSRRSRERESFVYPLVADAVEIMLNAGLTLHNEIIWHKGSANAGALNGRPLWGSYPYPPTPKILDSTFENILIFRKPGPGTIGMQPAESAGQCHDSIWTIPPDRDPHHPATFPMEIADRVVKMYSKVNDLVLDPFAGSGTTVIAAEKNGRTGIGYEIANQYRKAVQRKADQWIR